MLPIVHNRVPLLLINWGQRRRKCSVESISTPQFHNGFCYYLLLILFCYYLMLLFIIRILLNVLIFEKKICKIDEEATGRQKYVSLVVSLLENKKKETPK